MRATTVRRCAPGCAKTYNLSELVEWAGVEHADRAARGRPSREGRHRDNRERSARPGSSGQSPTTRCSTQSVKWCCPPTGRQPSSRASFQGIDGAEAVLLFGSWAARYLGKPGRAPNDTDVLVIGSPDRDAVDDAAERAERRIGLPVQATVRTRAQWEAQRESFIKEVRSRPLVLVLVAEDDAPLTIELRQLDGLRRAAP